MFSSGKVIFIFRLFGDNTIPCAFEPAETLCVADSHALLALADDILEALVFILGALVVVPAERLHTGLLLIELVLVGLLLIELLLTELLVILLLLILLLLYAALYEDELFILLITELLPTAVFAPYNEIFNFHLTTLIDFVFCIVVSHIGPLTVNVIGCHRATPFASKINSASSKSENAISDFCTD